MILRGEKRRPSRIDICRGVTGRRLLSQNEVQMAKYKFGEPKFSSKLVRKSKGAPTVPRVLIVCEGSKTEPNYLKDVCKYLGIGSAVVHVVGEECGSAPLTLVEYAKECIR